MSQYDVVDVREESAFEHTVSAWLDTQRIGSIDNIESAARLIIGLVSGLLTLLFGVLVLNPGQNPLPIYMERTDIRWLSAGAVVLQLICLASGIVAVLPFPDTVKLNLATSLTGTFQGILNRKAIALFISAVAFALGMILIGIVLVIAVLLIPSPATSP